MAAKRMQIGSCRRCGGEIRTPIERVIVRWTEADGPREAGSEDEVVELVGEDLRELCQDCAFDRSVAHCGEPEAGTEYFTEQEADDDPFALHLYLNCTADEWNGVEPRCEACHRSDRGKLIPVRLVDGAAADWCEHCIDVQSGVGWIRFDADADAWVQLPEAEDEEPLDHHRSGRT